MIKKIKSTIAIGGKAHKRGDRVIIKREDVAGLKQRLGTIRNIDGANIMVKPYRSHYEIELYPEELDPLPFPVKSAADLRNLLANLICAGDRVKVKKRFTVSAYRAGYIFRAVTTGAYGQLVAIKDENGNRLPLKYSAFNLERVSA